jgi:hypothetical protein
MTTSEMSVRNGRIALLAAPKRQRGTLCRAAEQFDPSPVFRRGRDFCSRLYDEWYILSAAHGLLAPHRVIGPGELSFHQLNAECRAAWGSNVASMLRERQTQMVMPVTFVIYASQLYADVLLRTAPDLVFERPLAGMSLSERLRWYDERLVLRSRLLLPALPQ